MTNARPAGSVLELRAPLAGWVLPLAEVPDPVFAGVLAGDGLAIDPIGSVLHAPCDGVIALMGNARHALTLNSAAGALLMHVGIDTVKLAGAGFSLLVRDGEAVRSGQPLLEFDPDAIARAVPSLVTPIVLSAPGDSHIVRRQLSVRLSVGDFLMAVKVPGAVQAATADAAGGSMRALLLRVPFDHGLHARPAARVAASMQSFQASVVLHARGRSADARSTVALMSLGANRGDIVEAEATGLDASQALMALARLLEPIVPAPALASTRREPGPPSAAPVAGTDLPGVVAVAGLSVGVAATLEVSEPELSAARGDANCERERLRASIAAVTRQLQELAASGEGTRRGVLDAHLALLGDPQLLQQAERLLERGLSAAAAWRQVLRDAAAALAQLRDERMTERRADLLDIERQVLRNLAGLEPATALSLPENAIVIADDLLPSQLLSLDASRLRGLCVAAGGATSHVAILAASMGLPMLVACGPAVLRIAGGTPLVLDADRGVLQVDPPTPERERVSNDIALQRQTQREDEVAAHLPARSLDGTLVHVYCNLGAAAEAAPAVRQGAEGCGLLRTEFLFLDREREPSVAEQRGEYQAIADSLGERVLTIRTLDAGGDKPIAYLAMPREDNPALGLRGLRAAIVDPGLFARQLQAIVGVRSVGQVRVLLPMVTDVEEVRAVRAQLARVALELACPMPALGIMIETPASALLADQLAAEVDFLSIGSNDLSQYTLAIDRMHATLASRLDALHPAVLRLIDRAAQAGNARGIEVGV